MGKKYGPVTWIFVDACEDDAFALVPGRKGTGRRDPHEERVQPQMRVFKNFQFDGSDDSLREMFRLLFPGGMHAVLARVGAAMQKTAHGKSSKALPYERDPLTEGEFLVFLGILIAATLFTECGRELFEAETMPHLFFENPNFHLYQGRNRFEFIKAHAPFAFDVNIWTCLKLKLKLITYKNYQIINYK